MYEYTAVVIKVVDGDTIDLKVDQGFRTFKEDRFRLAGINAPDNENPSGKTSATTYLSAILPVGEKVRIVTEKDKTEKYGRWLATVWAPISQFSVNQLMLNGGYAKPYSGGPRV